MQRKSDENGKSVLSKTVGDLTVCYRRQCESLDVSQAVGVLSDVILEAAANGESMLLLFSYSCEY